MPSRSVEFPPKRKQDGKLQQPLERGTNIFLTFRILSHSLVVTEAFHANDTRNSVQEPKAPIGLTHLREINQQGSSRCRVIQCFLDIDCSLRLPKCVEHTTYEKRKSHLDISSNPIYNIPNTCNNVRGTKNILLVFKNADQTDILPAPKGFLFLVINNCHINMVGFAPRGKPCRRCRTAQTRHKRPGLFRMAVRKRQLSSWVQRASLELSKRLA